MTCVHRGKSSQELGVCTSKFLFPAVLDTHLSYFPGLYCTSPNSDGKIGLLVLGGVWYLSFSLI